MRLYREFSTWSGLGVRTPFNPTSVTAATSTVAGVGIEAPVPANNGAVGRYYVDTTDVLYTSGVTYRVAWTWVRAGVTTTRTVRFRHSLSGGDMIAPGPPDIGTPALTSTIAVFPHTPPTDADYALTTVYCVPINGGTLRTGTGIGSTITVSGLLAATPYMAVAVAQDVTGNRSTIDAGCVVLFATLAADPATPTPSSMGSIVCKWWVNGDTTVYETGPDYADPSWTGYQRLGGRIPARGRSLRFRWECDQPVPLLKIQRLVFVAQTSEGAPGGLRNDAGN